VSPILLIGGPTATGKSSIALSIAESYGAVVVSADAMTVWRTLDVGTAKPSADELARVHHFCVNVRNIDEEYNVSDFTAEVAQARSDHQRVIVAGGTPFWLAALVRPHAKLPAPDPTIRRELEAQDNLWDRLQQVDPVLATRLHPNDKVRLVRALEVQRLTGRPMSEVQADPPVRPPVDAEVVWLDREDLRDRIGQRIEIMLQQGYLDEVRGVLARGAPRSSRPLRSFAYRHFVDHIADGLPLEEAVRRTERDTWKLARKQRTWARGLGWTASSIEEAWRAADRLWGEPPASSSAPDRLDIS